MSDISKKDLLEEIARLKQRVEQLEARPVPYYYYPVPYYPNYNPWWQQWQQPVITYGGGTTGSEGYQYTPTYQVTVSGGNDSLNDE